MISQRALEIEPSPIRKLSPLAEEAKTKGIKVYHLNIGQPDIKAPSNFLEGISNYKEPLIKYGPSEGLEELRIAFSEYYNDYSYDVLPSEIMITTGGSEAIIFSLLVALDCGDELIVPEPFYTNYRGFAKMAGVKIVPVNTDRRNNFHLSIKELEKAITNRTKAILLCNPGNPTGTVYTEEELREVSHLIKKYNLFLLSDEVYREFVYDSREFFSAFELSEIQDRVIVMDSVSKRFSLCGARIGTVVSKNKEVIKVMLKFAQARLCPPTVEQILVKYILTSDYKDYIKKVVAEYERRRNLLYTELNKISGVYCGLPEGAFYIMVDLPVSDTEKFSKWLLTKFSYNGATVMLAPGNGFYQSAGSGKTQVRMAYILKEEALRNSVEILKHALNEYK